MNEDGSKVLILCSGGVDSTTLIPYYQDTDFEMKLFWVEYGQNSASMENLAVSRISKHYGLELIKLKSGIKKPYKIGFEYQGRNLFLVSLALLMFPYDYGIISAGIRFNFDYSDCSEPFVSQIKSMVEFLSNGRIGVDLPLVNSAKTAILEYCVLKEVPLEATYSCEQGNPSPCNTCPSCIELNQARQELGLEWSKNRLD